MAMDNPPFLDDFSIEPQVMDDFSHETTINNHS